MGNTPSAQREPNKSNGGLQQTRPSQSVVAPSYNDQHQSTTKQQHPTTTTQAAASRPLNLANNLSTTAQKPSPSLTSAQAEPVCPPRSSASHVLRAHAQIPPAAPLLRPVDSATPASASTSSSTMGQGQSRQSSAPSSAGGNAHAESAKPIDMPGVSDTHSIKSDASLPTGPIPAIDDDSYFLPASEFYGPPRLPLPIETEEFIPGSPVISPEELSEPNDPIAADFPPQKTHSILSDKTVDEEDVGDDPNTVIRGILPTVPTIIEWREPGVKVYVTGTFADWERKYRLNKK
jgi:AMP-activated protein kinase-like protein